MQSVYIIYIYRQLYLFSRHILTGAANNSSYSEWLCIIQTYTYKHHITSIYRPITSDHLIKELIRIIFSDLYCVYLNRVGLLPFSLHVEYDLHLKQKLILCLKDILFRSMIFINHSWHDLLRRKNVCTNGDSYTGKFKPAIYLIVT